MTSEFNKNKKEIGKYTIEVHLCPMGYKGPVVFEKEYPANSKIENLEKIAEGILISELRARRLEHGIIYNIYQNVPVIEKKRIAEKGASQLKKEEKI